MAAQSVNERVEMRADERVEKKAVLTAVSKEEKRVGETAEN